MLNHANVAGHKAGNTIQVLHGAKIKSVAVSHLLVECAVLEAGEIHRPDLVSKQMEWMLENFSAARDSVATRGRGKASSRCAVGLLHEGL